MEKILFKIDVTNIITPITIKILIIPTKRYCKLETKASGWKSISPPKNLVNNIFFTPYYKKNPKIIPPAITDAICPETFTPIECISKKF